MSSTVTEQAGEAQWPPGATWRASLLAACLVALLTSVWVWYGFQRHVDYLGDFNQIVRSARALLSGGDPYGIPADQFQEVYRLHYPLPAVLVGIPFLLADDLTARVLWPTIGAFCFTLALMRVGGRPLLPAVMSGAFLSAASLGQWSPLLAASLVFPWLGWSLVCKPNMGAAVFVAMPTRRHAVVAVVLSVAILAASFVFDAHWVAAWRHALSLAPSYRPYVFRAGGALLLAAALRWRRPEARWLLVIACLPGTPGVAESLPLFLYAGSLRVAASLALITYAPVFGVMLAKYPSYDAYTDRAALLALWTVYLPVLVAIVRRPNVGPAPAWVERLVERWPRWLRGAPAVPSASVQL